MEQTKKLIVKSDTALAETTTTIKDTVSFDITKMPNGITYKGLKAVMSFSDPIEWDIRTNYEPLTIVYSSEYHASFVSKRPVAAGININNDIYWLKIADGNAQLEDIKVNLNNLEIDVDDLEKKLVGLSTSIGKLTSTTPIFVDSVSEMEDTSRLYVLKSNGHVYVYENQWVDTGVQYSNPESIYYAGNITNSNITPPYDDLNTLPVNIAIQYSTPPRNAPVNASLEVFSFGDSREYCTQIAFQLFDNNTGKKGDMYTRVNNGNGWSEWRDSHAYMKYAGNITASSLTPPYDDLNKLPVNIVIQYSTPPRNAPVNASLEVFSFGDSSNYSAQIAFQLFDSGSGKKGDMYTRVNNGNGWSKWTNSHAYMKYAGNITASSLTPPYDDLNTLPANVIAQYTVVPKNSPVNVSVEVATFGDSSDYSAQIAFQLFDTNTGKKGDMYTRVNNGNGWSEWRDSNKKHFSNILAAYSNITCIGDSLTYSQVYLSKTSSRKANKPWPDIIASISNAQQETYATPGATAKSWWNKFNGTALIKGENKINIVYLGTNEGLTNTVNDDCPSGTLPETWADTNTGYYGRILSKIYNNKEKAILVKVYSSSGNVRETNTAIEEFGKRFNFPVVDNNLLSEIAYHAYEDGSGYNGVHYNDIGYAAFAYSLINNINNMPNSEKEKLVIWR